MCKLHWRLYQWNCTSFTWTFQHKNSKWLVIYSKKEEKKMCLWPHTIPDWYTKPLDGVMAGTGKYYFMKHFKEKLFSLPFPLALWCFDDCVKSVWKNIQQHIRSKHSHAGVGALLEDKGSLFYLYLSAAKIKWVRSKSTTFSFCSIVRIRLYTRCRRSGLYIKVYSGWEGL